MSPRERANGFARAPAVHAQSKREVVVAGSLYLWVKALHVIAVIAWMAGHLYLPRLFVYRAASPVGSPQSETFKVMEGKLMRIIMNPAMIVAWLCGIGMIAMNPALLSQAWLMVKLVLVLFLSAMHGVMSRWRR